MAWYEHDRTPIRRCLHGCHMAPDVYDEKQNPACSICLSKMLINRTPVKKTSIKKLIEPEPNEEEQEHEEQNEEETAPDEELTEFQTEEL